VGLFRSTQVVIAILLLTAAGLGIFAYKVFELNFPVRPDQSTDLWNVETRVRFEGRGEATSIRVARARETPHLAILTEQHWTPPGFGQRRGGDGGDRFVTFERRTFNTRASVYYRAIVVELDSGPDREIETPTADDSYDEEARRILAEEEETPFIFALNALIASAREGSASDEGFVAELIDTLADSGDDRVIALGAGGPEGVDEPARRLALVLNAAGVPARRVSGLALSEAGTAGAGGSQLRLWVDVWFRDGWRSIDPATGDELDERYLLPLATGEDPVIETAGVNGVAVSYTVTPRPEDAATEALRRSDEAAPLVAAVSLLSLPQDTQNIFRVLMLIPVGAVLIAFLRQVVGLSAFGTFMPVLIALAFRETTLWTGVVLFTGIVMIGLGLRAYFNGLQLLIVPRLAAVLSIVVMLMALLALFGTEFNVPPAFSTSLFPLVIITMTIERMSLVWDEFGAREALTRGAGSLFAAVLAYVVMTNDYVEHLAFMFPELLLVLLAVMIALGRYNGYKLTEYFRFRTLAEPDVR
jgi:hypothetical protein